MTAPTELDYSNLLSIIADIREKSGVGAKPMLSELADAIAEKIAASGAGWRDAETELPPLEQVVLTRRASGYDGSDVYAFGARVDDGDGWLWGEQASYGGGVRPDQNATWNSIEADDDYRVTHWMPLPSAPAALDTAKGAGE